MIRVVNDVPLIPTVKKIKPEEVGETNVAKSDRIKRRAEEAKARLEAAPALPKTVRSYLGWDGDSRGRMSKDDFASILYMVRDGLHERVRSKYGEEIYELPDVFGFQAEINSCHDFYIELYLRKCAWEVDSNKLPRKIAGIPTHIKYRDHFYFQLFDENDVYRSGRSDLKIR